MRWRSCILKHPFTRAGAGLLCAMLPAACSKQESGSPTTAPASARPATLMTEGGAALETLLLEDVQALRGGRILYLRGDGGGVCRVINRRPPQPDFFEKRFVFTVDAEVMASLMKTIDDRAFFDLTIPERAGVPDEARPTITVTLRSGKSRTVAQWANDKHEDFDVVYRACLAIADSGAQREAQYDGKYDASWAPSGFQAP